MDDRRLLYAAVACRATSIGVLGVVLSYHLADRGLDPAVVGHVVSAGLLGTAVATALVPRAGDRWGVRAALLALTALSIGGIATVTWAGSAWVAVAAAFVGMLNGAGRDRGPLQAVEHAAIAARVEPYRRTTAYAIYNLFNDAAIAFGSVLPWLAARAHVGETDVHLGGMVVAGAALVPAVVAYLKLSPALAERAPARPPPLSKDTRSRLVRLCALFALDSLGGGFIVKALIAAWFQARFHVSAGTVGLLFAGGMALNALSHLAAAWLARRIGLLNTMVFTHTPSSVLLFTVAIAPSFEVAAVLFLLREGLSEMDVPTRTSYVMAIVAPEERTRVSAAVNLVRILAWAVAAEISGRLLESDDLVAPLAAAAVIKVAYDALLFLAFRRIRPPEEH